MLNTTLIIIVAVAWVCGSWANKWYQQRLDGLEEKLIRDREMEFSDWKRNLWSILMVIAWLLVLIYESATNFKQWRYPRYLKM